MTERPEALNVAGAKSSAVAIANGWAVLAPVITYSGGATETFQAPIFPSVPSAASIVAAPSVARSSAKSMPSLTTYAPVAPAIVMAVGANGLSKVARPEGRSPASDNRDPATRRAGDSA